MADTGAPANIPLFDDNTVFTPIQAPFNAISQALNTAFGAFQRLTVVRVTDAAARDVLFPNPTQGDRVYRRDLGYQQVYREAYNAATNPAGAQNPGWKIDAPGLIPIVPTSVVGATLGARGAINALNTSSIVISNCFSSDFENYKLVFSGWAMSVSALLTMQLRAANTTSAAGYNYQGLTGSGSATAAGRSAVDLNVWSVTNAAGVQIDAEMTIFGAAAARNTKYMSTHLVINGTTMTSGIIGGYHNSAAAYDSLVLGTTSGVMNGSLRIFGFNDN